VSISTNFCRADKPDLIVMLDFGTSNFSARALISSWFALPSTGGDFRYMVRLLSSSSIILGILELGLTLTRICIVYIYISLKILGLKKAHRDRNEQKEDYI
jgi:hypothetical protein